MIALLRHNLSAAVALIAGFSIAVLLAPIVLATADWYATWHAENNPPATLEWHSVERLDPDSLRMQILVTRHQDCEIARVRGYSGDSLQAMYPATAMEREDGRAAQSYPVGISVISPPWLMRGIFGNKVAVSVYYDCADAIVKAPLLIGDVPP